MLMPGRRALTLLLLFATLAALVGCGQTRLSGSDRTLFVALTDYRVLPQNVLVSSGSLTILAHNYGRLTHNLAVSLEGGSSVTTRPISPGQSAELTLTLEPGTYQMASTILSDQALGEYGTLKVSS